MKLMIMLLIGLMGGMITLSCNKGMTPSQTAADESSPDESPYPEADPYKEVAPVTGMDERDKGFPVIVPNVAVTEHDIDGGIALEFRIPKAGDVRDLRSRVHFLAEMYDGRQIHDELTWFRAGSHGRGHGTQKGMAAAGPDSPPLGMANMTAGADMPKMKAEAFEIDEGMRLELRPMDSAEAEKVREHVRWHQKLMVKGYCWLSRN